MLTKKVNERRLSAPQNIMLICQIDGRAGSLYELLGDFAKRKVNMTRIESRPARTGLGEYIFFIEIDIDVEAQILKEAISSATKKCFWLKNLGAFPVFRGNAN